jgi:hypothetical protein
MFYNGRNRAVRNSFEALVGGIDRIVERKQTLAMARDPLDRRDHVLDLLLEHVVAEADASKTGLVLFISLETGYIIAKQT